MFKNRIGIITHLLFIISFIALMFPSPICLAFQVDLKGIDWTKEWGREDYTIIYSDIHGNNDTLYTICSALRKSDCISFLVKWDVMGNQLWNRSIGTTSWNSNCFTWSNDNNCYTLFGDFLIKWDIDGNQIWNRTILDGDYILPLELCGDATGIYILANNFTSIHSTLSFIKFDYNLSIIWQKNFKDISLGDFWIGETNIYTTFNYQNDNLGLIKWDKSGVLIWNKTYDFETLGFYISHDYRIFGNSSVLYCGGINYEESKLCLVKLDDQGNLIWTRNIDLTDSIHLCDVWVYKDNIYLSGYRIVELRIAQVYSFLVKYDSNGLLIWNKNPMMLITSFCGKNLCLYLCGHNYINLTLAKWYPSQENRTNGVSNKGLFLSTIVIYFSITYLVKRKKNQIWK